jgi:hypothetical protein
VAILVLILVLATKWQDLRLWISRSMDGILLSQGRLVN